MVHEGHHKLYIWRTYLQKSDLDLNAHVDWIALVWFLAGFRQALGNTAKDSQRVETVRVGSVALANPWTHGLLSGSVFGKAWSQLGCKTFLQML